MRLKHAVVMVGRFVVMASLRFDCHQLKWSLVPVLSFLQGSEIHHGQRQACADARGAWRLRARCRHSPMSARPPPAKYRALGVSRLTFCRCRWQATDVVKYLQFKAVDGSYVMHKDKKIYKARCAPLCCTRHAAPRAPHAVNVLNRSVSLLAMLSWRSSLRQPRKRTWQHPRRAPVFRGRSLRSR